MPWRGAAEIWRGPSEIWRGATITWRGLSEIWRGATDTWRGATDMKWRLTTKVGEEHYANMDTKRSQRGDTKHVSF